MVKKSVSVILLLAIVLLHGCATVPIEQQPGGTNGEPAIISPGGQNNEGLQSIPAPEAKPGQPQVIPPQQTSVFNSPLGEQYKNNSRPAAVVALLDRSHQAERQGDLGQAAASIERSLRITPQDAGLWQRLARIRFIQKKYSQSIALAKKSNNLGTGYTSLIYKNWLLIADAYAELGNGKASQHARLEAQKYY